MPGELTFKPLKLEFPEDPKQFKQDPYVCAKMGDKELRTLRSQALPNNTYSWEKGNILQFYNKSEPSIKFYIKDADKKEPDDEIGDVKVDLDILESNRDQTCWYDIYQKNKVIGRMLLEGHYQPDKDVGVQNMHGTAFKPEFQDQSRFASGDQK